MHRQRDDRKEWMKGSGKGMGLDRQKEVKMWGKREVRQWRINQFILRVREKFFLVRKDGRKRKLHKDQPGVLTYTCWHKLRSKTAIQNCQTTANLSKL